MSVLGHTWKPGTPTWEVLAFSYATSDSFPKSALVRGAPKGARHPMGWYFWLLRGGAGGAILVDTGVTDPGLRERWHLNGWRSAADLLGTVGVEPGDVRRIILTHGHSDHAGGLAQFPDAHVWLRAREYRWMKRAVSGGRKLRWGVLAKDVVLLQRLEKEGRLHLMGGATVEVFPGVLAVPEGGHTPGSQWLLVHSKPHDVLLASDNAYLYENLEQLRPVGTASSVEENGAALETMAALGRRGVVLVPGHDREVSDRFPEVAKGVLRLSP